MSTIANQLSASEQKFTRELGGKVTTPGSGYETRILTLWDGKIYEGYGTDKENLLVTNIGLFNQALKLEKEGKIDEAEKLRWAAPKYEAMLDGFNRVLDLKEQNPYIPVDKLVGAAGTPLIATDFSTVRRVNDLAEVKGPQHVLEQYNAINVVTVKPTPNFYLRGFVRNSILYGRKEISDHVTPDPVKNAYSKYEVDLFADAYRYETTLRERQEVSFNLEQQYAQDVPGIFAKLKDDKITTGVNALSASATSPVWDTITSAHWTYDAAEEIAKAEKALASYGGAQTVLWPMAVARGYDRNVGGMPPATSMIGMPASTVPRYARQLARNQNLMGFENNSVTAKALGIFSPMWASIYQGPEIQIAYQNVMTPGQIIGVVHFNFNKFNVDLAAAAYLYTGALS